MSRNFCRCHAIKRCAAGLGALLGLSFSAAGIALPVPDAREPVAAPVISPVREGEPALSKTDCERGLELLKRGDFQEAREAFSQVIKKNLSDAAAYLQRGNSNYALREYEAALKDYSSAIELNPNDADAYYRRGNAYYASGKYALAVADFTESVRRNPERADTYYRRGNADYALKDYRAALADYTEGPDKAWEHLCGLGLRAAPGEKFMMGVQRRLISISRPWQAKQFSSRWGYVTMALPAQRMPSGLYPASRRLLPNLAR
ncbi:MAG: tetratricopeptide repeat protein [Oscillatoria sp. Prado101]|nr:tetratricopeptide repeat protein [Oscillatoria sp. Prado101]